MLCAMLVVIHLGLEMGPLGWRHLTEGSLSDLRLAHALCWGNVFGVEWLQQWATEESYRLNRLGDGSGGQARPVHEYDGGKVDWSKPVVIRQAAKFQEWTMEKLVEREGEYWFQADNGNLTDTSFEGYESQSLTLKEGFERGYYMRQNARLLKRHPDLLGNADKAMKTFIGSAPLKVVFAGQPLEATPTQGSSLHTDVGENWYLQTAGLKNWTLVDPKLSTRLVPVVDNRKGVPAMFSMLGYSSAIDSEKLGLKSLDSSFETYRVQLEPGDLLYVPSWWWHQIHNKYGMFNAAVSIRSPRAIAKTWLPFHNSPTFLTVLTIPSILRVIQMRVQQVLRISSAESFEDFFLQAETKTTNEYESAI